MTETATPLADRYATTSGHLRLWDPATIEFVWSNQSEPPEDRRPLLDVLAERGGWTLATFDWPSRGRVWSGRMRVGENGDVEERPDSAFLTSIKVPDNAALAADYAANPITADEVTGVVSVNPAHLTNGEAGSNDE